MQRMTGAAPQPPAGGAVRPQPAACSELSPLQRRALVGFIAALHGLLLWALLQVPAVRQAVLDTAPIFVNLIPPAAPPAPPPPPKAPAVPPRAAPLIVSKAAPAPASTFVVEPSPLEPPAPAPAAVEAAPPVPAPVAAPPKVIPASGVQYLIPPPLEYPRASQRMREAGKVMVRVYIDEDGLPRNAQVTQSSGHARLDEAAVTAVNKARFKPYTENGRPTAGWAFIPLTFDLEK